MIGDNKPTPFEPGQEVNVRKFIPSPEWHLSELPYSAVQLKRRELNYVKTESPWLIELTFTSNVDAALFCTLVQSVGPRISYYKENHEKARRYFFMRKEFTGETPENEVFTWVEQNLPILNSVVLMQFPHFQGASVKDVYSVSAEGWAIAHAKIKTVRIIGTDSMPLFYDLLSRRLSLKPYLDLSVSNRAFWKALEFFALTCESESYKGWSNLYKTFEVVRHDVGGTSKLLRRLGLTRDEVSRFTHTANDPDVLGHSARHAVNPGGGATNPMKYSEAVAFVATLLNRWYSLLVGSPSITSSGSSMAPTQSP